MNKKQKLNFKEKIANKLGLKKDQPLICIYGDNIDFESNKICKNLLQGLKKLPASVIIFSGTQTSYLPCLSDRELTLKGSDIILFLQNNSLTDVNAALENNSIPISLFDPNLKDYDPITEKGNAFLYGHFNEWEIYQALVRALENYKFPYDWDHLAKLH